MKQRAHAWVALRALQLIDESKNKKADQFIEMMSYYLSDVWEGAWLPDTLIGDMSYGHIFKMDSDPKFVPNIDSQTWLNVRYDELKKKTIGNRLCLDYAQNSEELAKPYWVTEQSGHLPDRVIAINHSIIDMLKMGDFPLAFYLRNKKPEPYLPKDLTKQTVKNLSFSPNFSARQIALTFFIASHYVCDAHMPLHCDLRDMEAQCEKKKIRRLPKSLHPGIEEVWEQFFPEKEKLTIHKYSPESIASATSSLPKGSLIEIDKEKSHYSLSSDLPSNMPNEWDEMVNICRISYAVSRKWIPQSDSEISKLAAVDESKADTLDYNKIIQIIGKENFKDVTNRIFHDAVESVARIWYRAWNIFTQ